MQQTFMLCKRNKIKNTKAESAETILRPSTRKIMQYETGSGAVWYIPVNLIFIRNTHFIINFH